MDDEKKLSVKDFIKHRKLQMKNAKQNQEETENLTQYVLNGDV